MYPVESAMALYILERKSGSLYDKLKKSEGSGKNGQTLIEMKGLSG